METPIDAGALVITAFIALLIALNTLPHISAVKYRGQICKQRLKLVSQKDGDVLLFDLIEDPQESKDISKRFPEEVQRLQDAYTLWNSEMDAPLLFDRPE